MIGVSDDIVAMGSVGGVMGTATAEGGATAKDSKTIIHADLGRDGCQGIASIG